MHHWTHLPSVPVSCLDRIGNHRLALRQRTLIRRYHSRYAVCFTGRYGIAATDGCLASILIIRPGFHSAPRQSILHLQVRSDLASGSDTVLSADPAIYMQGMTIVCAAPIGSAGALSSSAIACGIAAASRDADKHTPEIRVFTLLFIEKNLLSYSLTHCNEREYLFVTHNSKKLFTKYYLG